MKAYRLVAFAALSWTSAALAMPATKLEYANPYAWVEGAPATVDFIDADTAITYQADPYNGTNGTPVPRWVSTASDWGTGAVIHYSNDLVLWREWEHTILTTNPGRVAGDDAGHPANMITGSQDHLNKTFGAPNWANGDNQVVNWWAPEIHKVGTKFVLVTSGNFMYPARPGGAPYTRGGIIIGTASRIDGPYTFKSTALIGHKNETFIDPTIFKDPNNGKTYIIYVRWAPLLLSTGGYEHQSIESRELIVPTQGNPTVGTSVNVLLSTATQQRDHEVAFNSPRRIIEGPGLVYLNGNYLIYYAAGSCERDGAPNKVNSYTLNLALGNMGPGINMTNVSFTKAGGPSLRGNAEKTNTGHGTIVVDKAGKTFFYGHYISASDATKPRLTFFQEMLTGPFGYYFQDGVVQDFYDSARAPVP